jgi:nicotinamidase-related amidase
MDVLLIIDLQVASLVDGGRENVEGIVERINGLSARIRKSGGRVLFIQHDGPKGSAYEPHTKGWEILPILDQQLGDAVVHKTYCDSFYRTNLKDVLDETTVDKLIISGWATDFCVDTTLRAAVSHDYRVIVASDCHTCADRPHLKSEQVVEHHNWVWSEIVGPCGQIEVSSAAELVL